MKIRNFVLKRVALTTFCISFLSLYLIGQRTISGSVVDADSGEMLIGASVYLKEDPTVGTITDIDGNYSITLGNDAAALIFSYTGYTDQEIVLGSTDVINVALTSGELLEDIVVVGYGTVKREDLTGSIKSVSADEFNQGAITGPQQLIAGKVAGVSITPSGDPGGGSTIRVRAEASLSSSNDPLIVIDGVPLDNEQIAGGRNNLNIINPNDIESMTVLKDASATAIYGNRASAGVIIIKTKKGNLGSRLQVGYNGNVSVGKISNKVDVLDAGEYRSLIRDLYGEGSDFEALLGDADTDWQDEIYQNAVGTDHNLNFSGAYKNLPFRVSLGYTDMDGILKGDNFNRFTTGVNISPKYLDNRLQVNVGLKSMITQNQFANRGAIGAALTIDPTKPVYDSNSPFGGYYAWLDNNSNVIGLSPNNPVAMLEQRRDESDVNRYILNGSADYRFSFLPELRANLNLAYDISSSDGSIFTDTIAAFSAKGENNLYTQEKKNSLAEFYLNYKKELNEDHDIDVMAGYSWQKFGFESTNTDANLVDTVVINKDEKRELFLASIFGRLNYGFKDFALLTLNYRIDGTSRFATGNKYGYFPGAALAFKVLDRDKTSLKVRFGWGKTGQQDINSGNGVRYYEASGTYTASETSAQYQFGDEFVQTQRPNGYDEQLKWETTTTSNFGIDFGFLSNRITGNIDIFNRETVDLLNSIPLPAGSNLTNELITNVGDMESKGFEIGLTAGLFDRQDFTWDISANMSYSSNEITRLTQFPDPSYAGVEVGDIAGGVNSKIQIHSVGEEPYTFYVNQQKYDENGDILEGQFEDVSGNGTFNQNEDKYHFKSPTPDYVFGLSSYLNYKKLDFSFAARANVGNWMYNNVLTDMGYLNRTKQITNTLFNVHQAAVDNQVFDQTNLTFSDHFIEDASFVRVDHITLGYSLETSFTKNLRLYFTVQNPIVITNYSGLDPEVFRGIDNNVYPKPRTFIFGVSTLF